MTELSVYIAGSFTQQRKLKTIRETLQNIGCTVNASWLDDVRMSPDEYSKLARERADRDQRELIASRFFVIDVIERSLTGAMWVELGMAIAMGKIIWMVGYPSENPFTWHPQVFQVNSWDRAAAKFRELKTVYELAGKP